LPSCPSTLNRASLLHRVIPPSLVGLALCGSLCASALADPPHSIFVMNLDGTDVRRVVFIDTFPQLGAPRWSHDGRRLAFEARSTRPARALVVDVGGRNLIDLGAGTSPDWSPDDKQIVHEVPNAGRASVWVQNADGRGNSWLSSGSAPRWSPDGSQIALCAPLRLFDVLSGKHQSLKSVPLALGEPIHCDWSPDGSQLAVVVKRGTSHELLLTDTALDAKGPRVRLRARLHGSASFSPDGSQLAVAIHDPQLQAHRLHLLAVEGDDPPVPIPGQSGDNRDPAFSPDGKRLAFASTRDP
jgi:Tol biopolymer transport system component